MKKMLRNEMGYSILLVFFIMIIVSILSLALLNMSTQSLSLSTHEREDQSIFYFAEAGLTHEKEVINELLKLAYNETREEFKKDLQNKDRKEDIIYIDFYAEEIDKAINSKYTLIDKSESACPSNFSPANICPTIFDSFESQYLEIPEAEIYATIHQEDLFTINMTSTGYFVDNKSNSRTVKQSIEVKPNLKFLTDIEEEGSGEGDGNLADLAIWTQNGIVLSGNVDIKGNVATSTGEVSTSGSVNIDGTIIKNAPSLSELKLPQFPSELMNTLAKLDTSDDKISGNTIKLTSDTRLKSAPKNIDIGNNTINLYVDNLDISKNINIVGTGKLNIFVKNSITGGGSINANKNDNPSKLNIYHAGDTPPSFAGKTIIGGSYFLEKGSLSISGQTKFLGNIITYGTSVSISGTGSTNKDPGIILLAPYAHVTASGSFDLWGTIISNKFVASGNLNIIHKNSQVPLFPPDLQPDYSDPNEDLFEEKDLIEI